MLSKLSVKKPYTVAVFVVLVLILGAKSLTMMKTDLLPEMGLPYAVILTTCQGYNPETVETVVTRPVEQAMATVSNIKNIRSTTRENSSTVLLEFATDTDMDSVSLEMREKLDQISGYWDDNVGKPMIMKINPDMLPIMVADVEVEGMDTSELTDYVDSKISPEIESVAGVASVSVTGTVTESINVTIKEDRLKEVNELVTEAIRKQFKDQTKALDDAEEELETGEELLDESKEQLEDGEKQLEDGKKQLTDGIADGQKKLNEAQSKINSGTDEIDAQLEALELKQSELTSGKNQLTQTQTTLQTLLDTTKKAKDNLQKLIDLRNQLQEKEDSARSILEQAAQKLALVPAQPADTSEPETSAPTAETTVNMDEIIVDVSADGSEASSANESVPAADGSAVDSTVPATNENEIITDGSAGDSGSPADIGNEIVADVSADDGTTVAAGDNEIFVAAPDEVGTVPEANAEEFVVTASGDVGAVSEATVEEFVVTASGDVGAVSVTDAEAYTASASSNDGMVTNNRKKVSFMEADMSAESYAVPTEAVDAAGDGEVLAGAVSEESVIGSGDPASAVQNEEIAAASDETVLPDTEVNGEIGFSVDDIVVPDVTVGDGQNNSTDSNAELQQEVNILQEAYDQMKANREAAEAQIRVYIESIGMSNMDETSVLTALDEQISTMETSLSELSTKEQALEKAQAQLDEGRKQLKAAKKKAQDGQSQIIDGQSQLTTQQILATIEMSVGEANLATAQAQVAEKEASLSAAREQIDAQRDQLDDALQNALDAGNLENIVTRELIAGILASENFSMPAGYLTEGKDSWLVRVGDKVTDSDQLEDLVLLDLDLDGLDPIRLSDVAEVTRTDNSGKVYSKLNGKPAVQLTIQKQTGYSTGEVTDKLKKRLKEISAENEQIHFSIMMDQGIYIDLVVDSVISNMLSGAVLAILILLIFLRDFRSTLIIACSIPFSVVAAFVLMYFTGITLNVISLSGLALGIGMLVDNSIVVIENIDRLRKEGVPPRLAAVRGATGVSGAIIASTLTTVCVFAPIVFAEGITKQLFVDMGLTIAYSLGASLIVALTLVPAMSAALIRKNKKQRPDRIMDAVKNVYGKILRGVLRIKWLVILAVVGLLILSGYLAYQNGTAFLPDMESTQATITVTGPKGATFEELTVLTDEVVKRIEDIPDIEGIAASAGGTDAMMGMFRSADSNSATIYLVLKEDGREMNSVQLQRAIESRVEDLDGEIEITTQSMDSSSLGGSGIQLHILGRDIDTLTELSDEAAKIIEKVPGAINVDSGKGERSSEFRISVNKAKAMKYNLTVAQVFQAVNKRLAEASSATTLSGDKKDMDVFVQDDRDKALTRELLEDMFLTYTDSQNQEHKIRLSRIAEFSEAVSPEVIERENQSRFANVTAEVDQDHNIGLVSGEVSQALEKELKMPSGYTYEMRGEDATINDAMYQLSQMMALAVVLIYLIMVAQFQSLRSPFIIMFTLPLAFTGGLFGLVLADMEISVIAGIGFVVLAGIIVNNGIVLVDYTNELRAKGMSKKDALVKAGMDRLRPIIMTALTTILGLSISALGVGMGSDVIQPMAVVTIGGLIYGTLLTLLVVPCLYDLFNGEKYKTYELEDTADKKAEYQNQVG